MLYVIPAAVAVIFIIGTLCIVCATARLQAKIDRLERMRRLCGDPFGEPFGEIAPLPQGSILELRDF